MEDLASYLRGQGVQSEIVFQETVPRGVAASFIERQGIHELYVRRDQAETAVEAIARFQR
ncbi:MAG: hypothetical protein NDI61_01440 [Bdellovibrionaceae bacterium]|nr:hypothetical protein [Pseudobdellovibrionaceae bacterium]